MGDSVSKFFLDNSFLEEPKEDKEVLSEDVVNIVQLFRLLSSAEKVKVKQILRDEDIF
jgi:hypothetical protein